MKTKHEAFDCVEMKRKAQNVIQNKLKGLSKTDQLAFWAKRELEFLKEQRFLKQKKAH